MNASTGKPATGDAHLAQSIARILTTPIGTRLMRRDFGSLMPQLIDQPANQSTAVKLYGAIALALMRWEKRIRVVSILLQATNIAGAFRLDIEGFRTDTAGRTTFARLSIPLNFRS